MPELRPTSLLPRSRPLTRSDLETIRDAVDDGHRYEIVDGVLVVTPSPVHLHQRGVGNLYLLLRSVCPDDHEVLLAPFDVVLADDTVMQPDLLVARLADITRRDLPVAPVLAVEVLSPSTRSFDLHLKKERLRQAGCRHYWVVDPDPHAPTVTAWTLVPETATYEPAGTATGAEALTLSDPFDVTVVPLSLVER